MPEIKRIPKMRVASVSNTGPYGQAVSAGFEKLFVWLGSQNLHPAGASLGIFYDDPSQVAPEKLRSETCVVVSADVIGSGDVTVKEIGGFQAATTEYRGQDQLTQAYDQVYAWLVAQGYHDAGAPIETYLSKPGEELHAEIAVPVVQAKPAPAAKKKSTRAKKPAKKKPAKKKPAKKAAKAKRSRKGRR
jgi:DNA gyrase inhibitor